MKLSPNNIQLLLTEAAHPVPGIKWDFDEYFCWLAADRLLSIVTEQEAEPGSTKRKRSERHNWVGHADLVDPNTGARTLLPGLTDLLNRTMILPITWMTEFTAAPDGDWIYWQSYETGGKNFGLHGFHAAALDGSSYREWASLGVHNNDIHFFLDGRHLVHLNARDEEVIIRDLQNADNDLRYVGKEVDQAVLEHCASQQSVFLDVHPCYRGGEESIAVIDTYRAEDRLPFMLHHLWRPDEVATPLHTLEFELSEGTLYAPSTAILSPDQTWICYYLWFQRDASEADSLSVEIKRKRLAFESLWVSRADGSGMRKIGEMYLEPFGKGPPLPQHPLWQVAWRPDGKALSFIHKENLYIVRVEEDGQQ